MSGGWRTGADRALSHLRLAPDEEVFWIGRPVPRAEEPASRADLAAPGLAVAAVAVLAGIAAWSPHRDMAVAALVILVVVGLALWLEWRDRFDRHEGRPSDRYVVTSRRVAIVREAVQDLPGGPIFGLRIVSMGARRPPLEHVLPDEIASARRRGRHAVVSLQGKSPWDAFVLLSPDDPEGALRAIERLMAASPTPDAEPA